MPHQGHSGKSEKRYRQDLRKVLEIVDTLPDNFDLLRETINNPTLSKYYKALLILGVIGKQATLRDLSRLSNIKETQPNEKMGLLLGVLDDHVEDVNQYSEQHEAHRELFEYYVKYADALYERHGIKGSQSEKIKKRIAIEKNRRMRRRSKRLTPKQTFKAEPRKPLVRPAVVLPPLSSDEESEEENENYSDMNGEARFAGPAVRPSVVLSPLSSDEESEEENENYPDMNGGARFAGPAVRPSVVLSPLSSDEESEEENESYSDVSREAQSASPAVRPLNEVNTDQYSKLIGLGWSSVFPKHPPSNIQFEKQVSRRDVYWSVGPINGFWVCKFKKTPDLWGVVANKEDTRFVGISMNKPPSTATFQRYFFVKGKNACNDTKTASINLQREYAPVDGDIKQRAEALIAQIYESEAYRKLYGKMMKRLKEIKKTHPAFINSFEDITNILKFYLSEYKGGSNFEKAQKQSQKKPTTQRKVSTLIALDFLNKLLSLVKESVKQNDPFRFLLKKNHQLGLEDLTTISVCFRRQEEDLINKKEDIVAQLKKLKEEIEQPSFDLNNKVLADFVTLFASNYSLIREVVLIYYTLILYDYLWFLRSYPKKPKIDAAPKSKFADKTTVDGVKQSDVIHEVVVKIVQRGSQYKELMKSFLEDMSALEKMIADSLKSGLSLSDPQVNTLLDDWGIIGYKQGIMYLVEVFDKGLGRTNNFDRERLDLKLGRVKLVKKIDEEAELLATRETSFSLTESIGSFFKKNSLSEDGIDPSELDADAEYKVVPVLPQPPKRLTQQLLVQILMEYVEYRLRIEPDSKIRLSGILGSPSAFYSTPPNSSTPASVSDRNDIPTIS